MTILKFYKYAIKTSEQIIKDFSLNSTDTRIIMFISICSEKQIESSKLILQRVDP